MTGDVIEHWERRGVLVLLSILTTCFTVWAGVVWESSKNVVDELRASRIEDAQYRLVMEKRITVIEQQLNFVSQRQNWLVETFRREFTKEVPP